MSIRSLLGRAAAFCAFTATSLSAFAAPAGAPADGLPHTATFSEADTQFAVNHEVTVRPVGFPVSTGAVSVLEQAGADGLSNWSDLVIFYKGPGARGNIDGGLPPSCADAINLPQTANADTVLIISSPIEPPGTVPSPSVTLPQINTFCPGIVVPAGMTLDQVIQASAGYQTGPVELPETTPPSTTSVTYTAATGTYVFVDPANEPVPALPPWAFLLLGSVLAGSAIVVLRRRGSTIQAV